MDPGIVCIVSFVKLRALATTLGGREERDWLGNFGLSGLAEAERNTGGVTSEHGRNMVGKGGVL